MRIALDATPLSVATGGIPRYLRELAAALRETGPGDETIFLTDRGQPATWLTRRWWSAGLPLELLRRRVDLFHGVDFAVPYLPVCPSVMTLHDLSPWMDSTWHIGAQRVRARTPALLRLGLATLAITPCEAVRRQAIDRFLLPAGRVVSVPLAASPLFRPAAPPRRPRPYFLFVGTLEPRKNLATILEAWRETRRHFDADLVLAGRCREDFTPPAPEPGLEWTGAVPDDDLPALYAGAAAFLYPSHYEGFGLPVLEAMQCGAPVIVSRDAALGEVAGDAALRLEAGDPRAWAEALRLALANPDWRRRQSERSLQRAAQFSWRRTARQTREVYAEAIRRFGS
ncbi:MAG: glycosyltransferase family 4 protein [Acidobacteria bacterium]|nr:glycosyltransferase family 4 protein [Acidobacteriota bacterium]